MVRCFDSENIQHVNKNIDPINDLETIKTEILLADINQVEKKLQKNMKKKMTSKEIEFLEEVLNRLNKSGDLNDFSDNEKQKTLREIGLISIL